MSRTQKRFYELSLGERPAYFNDLGTTLEITGVLMQAEGGSVLLLTHKASEPDNIQILSPTVDQWSEILRWSDDPYYFELDPSGATKAVHRKIQRGISGHVQQKVWIADGLCCAYCDLPMGEVQLTVDHWIPLELGGVNDESNYLAACRKCNKDKGRMHPRDWCLRKGLSFEMLEEHLREREL